MWLLIYEEVICTKNDSKLKNTFSTISSNKKTTILRTSMFIFLQVSHNAWKISWKTYIGFCNVCNRSILQRWGRLVICGEIITTFKIRGLVFLTLSIFGEVIPKYLQNMQAQADGMTRTWQVYLTFVFI